MLKSYVLDIMEGRRPGRPLLRALSYLYRTGSALRNGAYDRGILRAHAAGLPVISIGNIVAGGTGKTPFVKFLAEELSKKFKLLLFLEGIALTFEKTGPVFQVTPETAVAFAAMSRIGWRALCLRLKFGWEKTVWIQLNVQKKKAQKLS